MTGEEVILRAVQTDEKVIALTFDDGPNPEYTVGLLDIFKRHNAKATFFVMGDHVDMYPEIVKQAYEEGHEIGNHTQTHPDMALLAEDEIRHEVRLGEEAIRRAIGIKTAVFRQPYGRRNEAAIRVPIEEGYTNVLWANGCDTLDWDNRTADQIFDVVDKNASPGVIVLMHDWSHTGVGSRAETVKAVERMVVELGQRGYRFVTVSELMKLGELKQ